MKNVIFVQSLLVIALTGSALAGSVLAQDSKQQRFQAWWVKQDQNGDGRIARQEASGLIKRYFDRSDTNDDGYLDKDELRKAGAQLARSAQANRNKRTLTDAQVRTRVPEGVEVELNIAYREGNDAWRLDLAKPAKKADSPRPAIVFVHGGGWVGGDKRAGNFLGPALDYAKQGYVTVTVNYRLDRKILPCVHDVKCAVRWLRAHAAKYNVDPERIGAYGNSAGAHLVTLLALSPGEKRLEGDGPWRDYSSALQAVAASATPALARYGTSSEEVKTLVAPITHVSGDSPPLLLFHDKSDRTVPVKNSDDLVAALKKAGAEDVTYKRYDNGSGHGVFTRNSAERRVR